MKDEGRESVKLTYASRTHFVTHMSYTLECSTGECRTSPTAHVRVCLCVYVCVVTYLLFDSTGDRGATALGNTASSDTAPLLLRLEIRNLKVKLFVNKHS